MSAVSKVSKDPGPAKKRVRKKHFNSKLGCKVCKSRRIKCGQELDSCYNCLDKNLKCSFLQLSDADKQKIVISNLSNEKFQNQQQSLEDEITSETKFFQNNIKSWASGKTDFYLSIDKMDFDFTKGLSTFSVNLPKAQPFDTNKLKLNQKASFKVLKMNLNNNQQQPSPKINPCSKIRLRNPELKSEPSPLPGAETVNKKFNVIKENIGVSSTTLDYSKLFVCSGEDLEIYGLFRTKMICWFFEMFDFATTSPLLFDALNSQSSFILLASLTKPYLKPNCTPEIIKAVERCAKKSRKEAIHWANKTIERLNMFNQLSDDAYLKSAARIYCYSSINISLTFFADVDYHNLLGFINDFLTTALVQQLLSGFNEALARSKVNNPKLYKKYAIFQEFFVFLPAFFLCNVNSILIPSIKLDLLQECYDDMIVFIEKIKPFESLIDPNILKSFSHLQNIIKNDVLTNNQVHELKNFVLETKPEVTFNILRKFLTSYPSEFCFLSSNVRNLSSVIYKIMALYWFASSAVLDNIFTESRYLFMSRFEGVISFVGYDIRLLDNIIEDLNNNWKLQNPKMFDYLYRRVIYLSRLISYGRYRWRVFSRNIECFENYPDKFLKGPKRFRPRRYKLIKETPITSMKTTALKLNHYPTSFIPPSIESICEDDIDYPNHPKLSKMHDENFHVNINGDSTFSEDFNIDTISLEKCEFSKWGLLKNIDFRPDLGVHTNFIVRGFDQFHQVQVELNNFFTDRYAILDYEYN